MLASSHKKLQSYWPAFLITQTHIKAMMHKEALALHSFQQLSCTDVAKGSFGSQHMQEFGQVAKLAAVLSNCANKAGKYSHEQKFMEHASTNLRIFFLHMAARKVLCMFLG